VADRDARGRFIKSGNPAGRPKGTVGKSYRRLLQERAEAEKVAVIDAMVLRAKTGDVQAANWLAKYEQDPSQANVDIAVREFDVVISVPRQPDGD
jgi:hypothetical protein